MGHTLWAMFRPVVGSMALAVGGLMLVRQLFSVQRLADGNDIVGNYLQTLGGIYAVLLGFVVLVVWTQFNEARAFVDRESNELLDLFRTVRGLPDPARSRLQESARQYARVVTETEWEAMACGEAIGPGAGADLLDQMWAAVHAVDAPVEPERSVYREVLKRLDDVSDARSSRLNSSRTKIPLALRVLLYAGAVSVVGSMYLFYMPNAAVHAAITASLAGAISHVLYVIEDLDNCFDGNWQVSRGSFLRVLQQMEASSAAASSVVAARAKV